MTSIKGFGQKLLFILHALAQRPFCRSCAWVSATAMVSIVIVLLMGQTFSNLSFTADLKTEIIRWDFNYDKELDNFYVLRLPPGSIKYEILFFDNDKKPNVKMSDPVVLDDWISLVLKGNASIQLGRMATGEVEVDVNYLDSNNVIKVYEGNKLLKINETRLNYISDCTSRHEDKAQCNDLTFRLPITAQKLIVGESIGDFVTPTRDEKQSVEEVDSTGNTLKEKQSITKTFKTLISGSLQIADKSWGKGTRYPLAETKLVVGDKFELRVETEKSTSWLKRRLGRKSSDERSMVRGSVSWSFNEDSQFFEGLHVVARKNQNGVLINRSGGGQYKFGVTQWEVLSSQPILQFIWVLFVSLLLVLGAVFSITDMTVGVSKD